MSYKSTKVDTVELVNKDGKRYTVFSDHMSESLFKPMEDDPSLIFVKFQVLNCTGYEHSEALPYLETAVETTGISFNLEVILDTKSFEIKKGKSVTDETFRMRVENISITTTYESGIQRSQTLYIPAQ